jgi:hypothetical protein
MKWLLFILFPLTIQAQDTVDWFKFPSAEFPFPEGIKGFQLVMQPLTVPVDMEIEKKFKASSGNYITGIVFPAFFSRPALQQEVFTVYTVNPTDTFFVRFFTPQSDSCGEYKFRVNTW